MVILIQSFIFLGVLMTVLALAQLMGVTGDYVEGAIKRRLQTLTSGADPEEVLRLLRRQGEADGLGSIPFLRPWAALVRQAGLAQRPGRLLVILSAGTLASTLVLIGLVGWILAPVIGLLVGLVIPVLVLQLRRNRRRARLSRQLPEAIDLMVQSLRAGHPINPVFQVIAHEMPDPIRTELSIVADAVSYGDNLTTAINDMARRIGLEDFNYLAVAITIQHSTGGNLVTVLESLACVIRDRFAIERKVRALTAEGRITAYVVSIIPVALAAVLQVTSPSYYADVADDPLFMPFLGLGIVLTLANALALRQQVRFHV